jgi:hypothetical protein
MSKASKKARRAEGEIRIEEVFVPAISDPIGGVSGRVLAGWMSQNQLIAFARAYAVDDDEVLRLTTLGEACQKAVAALDRGVDQSGLIQEVPSALARHVQEFRESAVGKIAEGEGFRVEYLDLNKLVAFQTFVRQASVRNYSLMVSRDDLASGARIALPIDFRSELRARFDPHRGAWHVFALDQNLRVIGPLGHPNSDGTLGVGFNFTIPPSLVKAQVYKGRTYLSDGYHRTAALLRKGFSESLALVREVSEFELLGAVGHLPVDSFMGDHPPLLRDYWDTSFSLELSVPRGARHFMLKPEQLS